MHVYVRSMRARTTLSLYSAGAVLLVLLLLLVSWKYCTCHLPRAGVFVVVIIRTVYVVGTVVGIGAFPGFVRTYVGAYVRTFQVREFFT